LLGGRRLLRGICLLGLLLRVSRLGRVNRGLPGRGLLPALLLRIPLWRGLLLPARWWLLWLLPPGLWLLLPLWRRLLGACGLLRRLL